MQERELGRYAELFSRRENIFIVLDRRTNLNPVRPTGALTGALASVMNNFGKRIRDDFQTSGEGEGAFPRPLVIDSYNFQLAFINTSLQGGGRWHTVARLTLQEYALFRSVLGMAPHFTRRPLEPPCIK